MVMCVAEWYAKVGFGVVKKILFSIICPAHNEEEYLGRTLDSILVQTEQSFEIIIILDNCTDKSLNITKQYTKKDKRIKYVEVKKGSAAGARNTGIKLSKGKYVIFQDSDCFMDPTLLNNAAKYFEDYGVDGIATRTTNVPPKNWVQRAVATQRNIRWENSQTRPMIIDINSNICVAIMKTSVVKKLGGFDEKIFYFEDADLTKRFFAEGYGAIFAPDVVQYHNDPLTLKESFGQCRSIAKGMHSKLKSGQKVSLMEWVNLFAGVIDFIIPLPSIVFAAVFLRTLIKSRDLVGSFYFGVLWVLRSIAKLWYFLTGWF